MHVTVIKQSDLLKCPHVIFDARTLSQDGSCRCNDPEHIVMIEWGYSWDGEKWEAPE